MSTRQDLELPDIQIPDAPPKRVPANVLDQWMLETYADLHKRGLIERIRRDPLRAPVPVRFVLK